jgi:hypothetical protein
MSGPRLMTFGSSDAVDPSSTPGRFSRAAQPPLARHRVPQHGQHEGATAPRREKSANQVGAKVKENDGS